MYYYGPYVSVESKRITALQRIRKLEKSGYEVKPIEAFKGAIAKTFWGKAWCNHLESFADYSNRLPRARSYLRNGCVCDLQIGKGLVTAKISGTSLYSVNVELKTLDTNLWLRICQQCQGQINSLVDLLQGKLSKEVMQIVCDPETGLFPTRKEIHYTCTCPDWAALCKHAGAALYAVGRRLDSEPELLFTLRGVDPNGLLPTQIDLSSAPQEDALEVDDLGALFGIDLVTNDTDADYAPEPPKAEPAKPFAP